MHNRVFVTGMGAITACGADLASSWQAITSGQSGIAPITQWDLADWEYPLGGEIKNYDARNLVPDRKLLKLLSRQDVIGLNAAVQAITHSGMLEYRATLADDTAFNDNTGIYAGSPGNKYFQQYDFMPLIAASQGDMQNFAEHLFEQIHPMWLLKILPNNVLAYVGINYNFKGANQNVTNHVVGGAQAILEAYHAIKMGQVARAVVVGYDLGFEPQGLLYYAKLGLISNTSIKPFDAMRDGTILAEGAGALILESEAAAEQRKAHCYAEILGGSSSNEAQGIFGIHEQGDYLQSTMQQALANTKLSAQDVGMVCAHGNGNYKSDHSESQAIRHLFGAQTVPVTAFKWATGHNLAAAGVLESMYSIQALQQRSAPGIATLTQVADYARELSVSNRAQAVKSPIAMVITRGFGSMNSCLLVRACE